MNEQYKLWHLHTTFRVWSLMSNRTQFNPMEFDKHLQGNTRINVKYLRVE